MSIWEQKLALTEPLAQAARCVDLWLEEENRTLPPPQKQRVVALIARYFHCEEDLTDALILSFLRHYSGRQNIDLEDPTSVRMQIKTLLDQTETKPAPRRIHVTAAFIFGILLSGMVSLHHFKIGNAQQTELKTLIQRIADADGHITHAALWAETKKPLGIRSYKDMSYWNYLKARRDLKTRLKESGS